MNWTLAVLQAIVIAGLSAVISYLVARRQKRLEFQYDYRKHILDKRKAAYDKMEPILDGLEKVDWIDESMPGQGLHFFLIEEAKTLTPFLDFSHDIGLAYRKNGFWLSPQIIAALASLQKTIIRAYGDYETAAEGVKNKYLTARHHFQRIEAAASEVRRAYYEDIIRLDDIELFKRQKQPSL